MRTFLLIVAALGTWLFGSLFVLSIASPISIERWARAAIEREVEARVGGEMHALSRTSLVRRAQALIETHTKESAFDRILFAALHNEVERTVARMQDPDCECRKRLLRFIDETAVSQFQWLGAMDARLTTLVESKYAQVSKALIREVRIFSGANALVFALLGLLALLRRESMRALLAPAFILLGSACMVGYFYLFQQDWLQTVLFGDYVGLSYFGYLGVACAFLADIALNRCRVTALLMHVVGSVPTSPC